MAKDHVHTKLDVDVVQKSFPDEKVLYMLPFGDIHWDSRYSNHRLIKKKIQEIKNEGYYTLLVGDTFDKLFFHWLLKDLQTDDLNSALETMAQLLQPIRDRIFLMMDGNHERGMEKKTGFNLGEALANKLKIPYCRGFAILHLRLGNHRKSSKRMLSYIGLITHGYGGGRTKGAKANKAARLGDLLEGCDFTIMGHVHDPNSIPTSRLVYDPRNTAVVQKDCRNIILSSFQNYPKYAQQNHFPPSPQLEYLIRFDGTEKRIDISERPI